MTTTTTDERIPQIWEVLHTVIDPELGIPITDLGLVYRVEMIGDVAFVDITTTTPVCPLGSYMQRMIETGVNELEGVDRTHVEIVHEPLWCPDRMNEAARKALGWDC